MMVVVAGLLDIAERVVWEGTRLLFKMQVHETKVDVPAPTSLCRRTHLRERPHRFKLSEVRQAQLQPKGRGKESRKKIHVGIRLVDG